MKAEIKSGQGHRRVGTHGSTTLAISDDKSRATESKGGKRGGQGRFVTSRGTSGAS
jgi:hypothetical protein